MLEERVNNVAKAQYVWSPVYVDALVERDRDANGVTTDGPRGDGLEERLYAIQDANHNLTSVSSSTGVVQERYVEDPFGQVTVLTAGWAVLSGTAFAWVYNHQGGRYENVSGLYHFRSREYSSAFGRWIQRDFVGYCTF